MLTKIDPEKVTEIENLFRAADTVGKFVDAVTVGNDANFPSDGKVDAAMKLFTSRLNDALVEALGGRDVKLERIPEVILLIEDYGSLFGTVSGMLHERAALAAQAKAEETGLTATAMGIAGAGV